MDIYNLPRLQRQYFPHSEYSPSGPRYPPADSLLQWPGNRYLDPLSRDNELLAEVITAPSKETASMAEQVFGQQLHQGSLAMKSLAHLINGRAELHIRHLRDIDHRHMQCQEALFGAKLNAALDGGKRQGNLEKILVQLEQNRRQEELAFWKDAAELREKLFESATEYAGTRHRVSLLAGLEQEYG